MNLNSPPRLNAIKLRIFLRACAWDWGLRVNAIELRILIGVTTRDYPYKINELRRGNPLWLPLTQWQWACAWDCPIGH